MAAPVLIDSVFTASYDREKEWRECCAVVMGFEWVDRFEEEKSGEEETEEHHHTIQQVINLMDDDTDSIDEYDESPAAQEDESKDHWTENALRIQADLTRMARWIRSKQHEYVSLEMRDDEASLIQSTVTSFAATTANELETLRKIIPSSSSNIASHRSGVVQILLSQLQEQIAEPFGALQRQRTRVAVQLWQNPLQCKLYQPKPQAERNRSMMQIFDEEDEFEREQRFLPRRQSPPDDYDFISKYAHCNEPRIPSRPGFLAQLAKKKQRVVPPVQDNPKEVPREADNRPLTPQIPIVRQKPQIMPYQQPTTEEARRQVEEDMQQEVAMLTVAVHNDLDSVQKMEQRMVQITTLISQFSNLVSEQQEEIWQIHDSAKETKENMDKGQENLVDAAEKTKRSKHYMAWTIFAMSMTLLFFHTLKN
jgi:t-SNARE complex subunit (syntaxin)